MEDNRITVNKPLMQEICDEEGYVEEWEAVLNKTKYALNPYQTALLKQEIAKGNRGVVMFKKFAISIPFIEEFYLIKRYKPGQERLSYIVDSDHDHTISDEARQRSLKKLDEIRQQLVKRGIIPNTPSNT